MFKQRILIQLSVRGDIRFISHHDLMRVLGRAARRAALPVAMSEGFNPRQKISLLLARGVGIASECELVEIDLTEWTSALEAARRLAAQLPEGLGIERVEIADPRRRRQVEGMDYRVACRSRLAADESDARRLLDSENVWVERRRKKGAREGGPKRVDIRPYIRDVHVDEHDVEMSLAVTSGGTARPEEVWTSLGLDAEAMFADCTVSRTGMTLSP